MPREFQHCPGLQISEYRPINRGQMGLMPVNKRINNFGLAMKFIIHFINKRNLSLGAYNYEINLTLV